MGTDLNRVRSVESLMTWLVSVVSGALEPAEREVVCGDLAESGESGLRALRQVLGLVVRRRTVGLRNVRSWLVLAILAIPSAGLLSLMARRTADGSAVYLWMWINNSDLEIIRSTAFWQLVREFAPSIVLSYFALACCSWTCGLLIGWSAQRTRWLSGLGLVAVIVLVAVWGLPRSLANVMVLQRARDFHGNAAVFLGLFYRWIFPVSIEVFLVILPAWWGMHHSSRIARFSRLARFIMTILCLTVLAVVVSQNLLWWQLRIWNVWPLRYPRLPSLAPLAFAAPTAYIFLIIRCRSILRREHSG